MQVHQTLQDLKCPAFDGLFTDVFVLFAVPERRTVDTTTGRNGASTAVQCSLPGNWHW